MANNHGMDYGPVGLADELAASRQYGLPVIGGGVNQASAFQGYQRTIRGVRVAVVSATDVLDSSLQAAWTAGPDKPGLASAKEDDLFAQRIKQVSADADVVVAFVHWGVEKQVCPTARQQQLAAELVAAGADVVVGSHAHVLQPLGHVDGAPVAYGMGNFVFYGTSASAVRSGVLAGRRPGGAGIRRDGPSHRDDDLGPGDDRERPPGRRTAHAAPTRCRRCRPADRLADRR